MKCDASDRAGRGWADVCTVLGRQQCGQHGRVGRAYRHYRMEMQPTTGKCTRVLFDFLRKCNG